MSVLSITQCVPLWRDGSSDRAVLYALRNITTGDTADLTAEFSVLKRAVILGTTVAGAAAVSVAGGNIITIPAGVAGDAGLLLCWGVSS